MPAIAALTAVAVALYAVILFAADQANQLSGDRQEALVRRVVTQKAATIGYEQESITVWNESLRQTTASRPDAQWLDDNLGIWLHDYYGHDEAYILDGTGRSFYAMRDGKRDRPEIFDERLRSATKPLIAQLKFKLSHPAPDDISPPQRTAGSQALALVGGHPAIVSVKPVAGDDGTIPVGGTPPMHISVRRLDGTFPAQVSREYQLEDARFVRSLPAGDYQHAPLRDAAGLSLGHIVWKPFEPGAVMLKRIAPFALSAYALVLAMVLWLLRRIRRGILALEASQAQARHLAFHDSLTGLPNRALFDDRLGHAMAEIERTGTPIALLYLNLDRFQQVNDALGHPVGDELIADIARRLSDRTRDSDFVARIAGDEFAIVQTGVTTAAAAEILCMRIMEIFDEPFELAGRQLGIGVSVGVALAPAHARSRTELARKADIALREAKSAGRARYVIFDEAMDRGLQNRMEIERGLRDAVAAGEGFELVYQPLYGAQSGQLCGAEALIRWRHPERGMMSPAVFIPVAEASGLVDAIGDWALQKACKDAVRLRLPLVAVNVSPVQIRNPTFAARTFSILKDAGLAPARLEIEITETSFIENEAACQRTIAALRAKGVKIALDDFGTGYSSLSHLRNFDVDRIKIDQSFVAGINMRDGGSAIIKAMVDLAKASALQVTAEGVETEEQARYLVEVGCDTLQGFYFSKPMAADSLRLLLGPSRRLQSSAA
ncbi:bifunctional diguanylate cyclase/phosphodiesterase [Sphingopyxis fribergensis]